MKLVHAAALPPLMTCIGCGDAISSGDVLVDDTRPWLVPHRACVRAFIADELDLLYREAIALVLEVQAAPEELGLLNRVVALQRGHAEVMRGVVERSAAFEEVLNMARRALIRPDNPAGVPGSHEL